MARKRLDPWESFDSGPPKWLEAVRRELYRERQGRSLEEICLKRDPVIDALIERLGLKRVRPRPRKSTRRRQR